MIVAPCSMRSLAAIETLGLLRDELESHMQKEDLVLFPMLCDGGHPMIAHPIAAMRHEHDGADELVRRRTLPEGACRSWTALYAGLGKFADDLRAHVQLENEVLFPRFETA